MNGNKLQMGGKRGAWLVHAGLRTIAAAAAVGFSAGAGLAAGEDYGIWLNTERKGKVHLRECGQDGLCGNIVWMRDPLDEKGQPWRDELNPDPALRSRQVIGIDVLIGAKKIAPMTWQGQIYDPEVGKVYYLKHLKIGQNQVEIKGCLPAGWPCRTKYWTRAEPPAPQQQTVQRQAAPQPKPQPRVAAAPPQAPAQPSPPPAPQARTPQAAPPPAPAPTARPARPQPPEATAALPPAQPQAGGYMVQVAARQSHNEALQAYNELQRRYPNLLGGYSPQVLRADLGQRGVWFRVGVGPVAQQSAAVDFCQQLKAAGADCLIRRN